jgi:hypothetical protein
LTDQQILDDAGVAHDPGHTFFDLSPYILFPKTDNAGWLAADAVYAFLNEMALCSPWEGPGGRVWGEEAAAC